MKRLFACILAFILIIPFSLPSFAENPTSLEAPRNLSVREDGGSIILRYTIPESVIDYTSADDGVDGDILYCVDWKVNGGPWQYDVPYIKSDTYDWNDEADTSFFGILNNIFWDEQNVQELVLTHWSFGLSDNIDLVNNKYTFRVRFAFYDYNKDENQSYVTSPYSNEVSIGGSSQVAPPVNLEAPVGLKVETRKRVDGSPYFILTWTNPASVAFVDQSFPIKIKADFKAGSGPWYSETHTHEWWGGFPFGTSMELDPVERQMADRVVIEENTYYFRILYVYEPVTGNRVISPFSNTVSVGINVHEWAREEVQNAFDQGLVPDILKGVDLTKSITREEFCEIAVLLYEKITGTEAPTVEVNPFIDTNNPQISKAFTLGITNGKDAPNTFKPKVLINRQECATALFRTMKAIAPNADYSIAGVKDFPDQKDISSWAFEATKYMAKIGILKGDAKTGKFMPRATTTVQEAQGYGMATREAAIIMSGRIYDNREQFLSGSQSTGQSSQGTGQGNQGTGQSGQGTGQGGQSTGEYEGTNIENEERIPEGYRRDLVPVMSNSRVVTGMRASVSGKTTYQVKYYTTADMGEAILFNRRILEKATRVDKDIVSIEGYTFEGVVENIKITITVSKESYPENYQTLCYVTMEVPF